RWFAAGGRVGFDVGSAASGASRGRGLISGVVKIVVVRIAALGGDFSRDDLHDWRCRPDHTRRSSRPMIITTDAVPFRRSRGQEGVAASLAQGGGLGAVLAGGGAEPARVVATGIDIRPAAVRIAAHAAPVPMAGGQEPAESLGADRGPHLSRRRVTEVVVHAPAAVFLGEMWVGGVCGEHRVEAGGRGVIV